MVTIKVNEKTEEGRALLEVARLFSKGKKGVEVLEGTTPNKETLEVFQKTDADEDVFETESHEDLLKKLYS